MYLQFLLFSLVPLCANMLGESMLKIHNNIDDFMILFYVDLHHRTDRSMYID